MGDDAVAFFGDVVVAVADVGGDDPGEVFARGDPDDHVEQGIGAGVVEGFAVGPGAILDAPTEGVIAAGGRSVEDSQVGLEALDVAARGGEVKGGVASGIEDGEVNGTGGSDGGWVVERANGMRFVVFPEMAGRCKGR